MADLPTSDALVAATAARRGIFLRSAAIVAATVLLSRVLGFFREWTLAHQVGSNAITDAYYAAFTIPDILNYLLAGGALSVTFLPVFMEYFASRREEEAWRVFSIVISFGCVALLILLVVAEVYAPTLTWLIAPGFTPEQHETVTYLTRIMLPAQAFFLIGGVLSAVQYAQGRFLVPSLAPLLYNGMIITFGIALAGRWGVEAFSWGVLAGSLLGNGLLQVYGVRRLSARFRFSLELHHPGFRRFLRMTVPIMLGFSVILVDDWAIRWFGSSLTAASITWLTYAKTMMRVVVGLFGQAASVAAFPILARLAAEEKWAEMREGLEDALRHVILPIVPMSLLLALVSRPVVYVLFSRTRLGPMDMEQTALAMEIFLVGAVAWGTQSILGRGYYALGDTLTPTLIGSGLAAAFIPLYWFMSHHHQHLGLAGASSIGVIVYTAVLWIVLFRRLKIPLAGLGWYSLRTIGATAGAGAIAAYAGAWVEPSFPWLTFVGALVQIAAVSAVFLASFLALASLARVASWRNLRGAFVARVGR